MGRDNFKCEILDDVDKLVRAVWRKYNERAATGGDILIETVTTRGENETGNWNK